ncbi:hypothetical protein A5730_22055 [Mycobacterium sp. ACS4054]|uniref:hypothetical protein n=1 Tax=Mycobacterium sp. ACS4054 TaxID=1834119 RepID=UPI0007FE9CAD|nr:hypothetical protein [Mycobacterium sp. ACS4054]OBF03171.1 hypothetical protein A5730_22055 [Mycobacterium sp. ACS4054]
MGILSKKIGLVLVLAGIAMATPACGVGCGGAASLLRVATDSMQSDPMQVNVVHSEEQVCISR